MSERRQPYIAVIGGYDCSREDYQRAEQVGAELARRGAVVVTGGRKGITEAACKGAKSAGGVTIGILPGSDYRDANDWVDYAICTDSGSSRNNMIIMTADGVIALPGMYGTLSEMAFALLYNKPIVSLGSWDVGTPVVEVNSPQEAVERILTEVQR